MIAMSDGTQFECKAGDVSLLPVGHDARVIADEEAIVMDFHGMPDHGNNSSGS